MRTMLGNAERAKIALCALRDGSVLFLLCVLQTTVLGRWKPFGAVPDLILCATILLGYCRGREVGAVGGMAGGTMLAMLGSVGVTIAPVFYTFVGYLCGYFARAVEPKNLRSYLFFLGVALPFGACKTMMQACLYQAQLRPIPLLLYAVLPEAAGSALFGVMLFFPLRRLIGRKKKR